MTESGRGREDGLFGEQNQRQIILPLTKYCPRVTREEEIYTMPYTTHSPNERDHWWHAYRCIEQLADCSGEQAGDTIRRGCSHALDCIDGFLREAAGLLGAPSGRDLPTAAVWAGVRDIPCRTGEKDEESFGAAVSGVINSDRHCGYGPTQTSPEEITRLLERHANRRPAGARLFFGDPTPPRADFELLVRAGKALMNLAPVCSPTGFSRRQGITNKALQVDTADKALRIGLWDAQADSFWEPPHRRRSMLERLLIPFGDRAKARELEPLTRVLWSGHLKKAADELPPNFRVYWYQEIIPIQGVRGHLKEYFFDCSWNEMYDFIETVGALAPATEQEKEQFRAACNLILERENAAWRFVGGRIAPVMSRAEVDTVEEALDATPHDHVKQHLDQSLKLLADRREPDYRNAIKEALSAVEALCRTVTGDQKATLGQALKKPELAGAIRPALQKAFSALYGYTSDEGGIRHAKKEDGHEPDRAEAVFFLVACSAFVNYVEERASVRQPPADNCEHPQPANAPRAGGNHDKRAN